MLAQRIGRSIGRPLIEPSVSGNQSTLDIDTPRVLPLAIDEPACQMADVGAELSDSQHPRAGSTCLPPNKWNQLTNAQAWNPTASQAMPEYDRAVHHVPGTARFRARAADGRTGTLPRPNSEHPAATGDLAKWPANESRPAFAKKCLDRARQMYRAAEGIFRSVIEAEGAAAPSHINFRKATGLAYATTPGQPQRPRHNRQSALWLVFMAYRLVRDVEVNPRARADPMRAVEDEDYCIVMGTRHMEPNRLAGNYANASDPGDAAANAITTDMAQCLRNVHANFPPNVSQPLLAAIAAANPNAATDALIQPRFRSWANVGEPYPANESPFPGRDPTYVPIFFPSGRSAQAPTAPPYNPADPSPPAGAPDSEALWDARAAATLLQTRMAQLSAIALQAQRMNSGTTPANGQCAYLMAAETLPPGNLLSGSVVTDDAAQTTRTEECAKKEAVDGDDVARKRMRMELGCSSDTVNTM